MFAAVRRTATKNDAYRFGQFLFDLRGVTLVTVNSATLRLYKFSVTHRGRDDRIKIEVHRLMYVTKLYLTCLFITISTITMFNNIFISPRVINQTLFITIVAYHKYFQ